ncbi:MAG: GNAT family N-acetyltransferase [Verrucomicrobiae bacterium]|nr:GNAT family N-acetyltransferase [Verrucomicrobiae bacterium]
MSVESILETYPRKVTLKNETTCLLRPLQSNDARALNDFFLSLHVIELIYMKHRVTDQAVTRGWCKNIDYGHNFPLLAIVEDKIIGIATLHQQLGGWKRHIGRVSVHVRPQYRGVGLGRLLVTELLEIARQYSLQRVEAEFFSEQETAIKMFAKLGFEELARIPEYVQDMQAVMHDYILMALDLKTNEEYAGMG